MNIEDSVMSQIEESIEVKNLFCKDDKNLELVKVVVERIVECYKKKGKVLVFGNGGSAADAQHLVAELVGRFKKERKALAAISLNTNVSTITALGNDYSFDIIFARQLEALAQKEDIVIGISTSGNSKNVLEAFEVAKKIGCITVGLTGKDGGKIKDKVDYCLRVPSNNTPRIQEMHIVIIHIICSLVEEICFSNKSF